MKLTVSAFVVFCFLGMSLGRSANRYGGNCKEKSGGSSYTCTKYGFYEVKQCKPNSSTCQCVDSKYGNPIAKVNKDDECPPCLLHNAERRKMIAEGMMDVGLYQCADDGYFNNEDSQCSWFACFCYTKDGEVAHMLTHEEISDPEFSCKSVEQ